MNDVLVCVPVSHDQAQQISAHGVLAGPIVGYATTPGLHDTFGIEVTDHDQAEYAATLLAGVASVIQFQETRVLAARCAPSRLSPGQDTPNGQVEVDELRLADIDAFFTDAQRLDPELVASVQGLSVDEAWNLEVVQRYLAEGALAWHDVSELR